MRGQPAHSVAWTQGTIVDGTSPVLSVARRIGDNSPPPAGGASLLPPFAPVPPPGAISPAAYRLMAGSSTDEVRRVVPGGRRRAGRPTDGHEPFAAAFARSAARGGGLPVAFSARRPA